MRSRPRPILVALHGHEDDDTSTRSWAERIRPQGWDVLLPRAVDASWFETTATGADGETLARSTAQLAEVVASASASGAPVVLAGFSQGAAMALAVGDLPGLSAVVAVCPFLPESERVDFSAGPPALLLPAAGDDVVPPFLGEDAAAAMSAAGREVSVTTVPGPHEVSGMAAEEASTWLEDRWPSRLRLSVGLPVDRVSTGSELVSGEAIAQLGKTWERIGFDAAFVTDHPAPDDRWLAAGGHHALEPTVALAVAGAATERLRLHTHVMVLAYRNPFLAAKSIASLDAAAAGRVILGVAAGYLRPEFEALGVDFERRGELLDESITTLRRIWSEDSLAVQGSGYSAHSVTALPRPSRAPGARSSGPPIWIGGNSLRAMRRAVELGDGWSPFPTPGGLDRAARTASITTVGELAGRLDRLDEMCAEHGRQRPTICFSPVSMGDYLADPVGGLHAMCEEAGQLHEAGVDWLALTVPGLERSEVIDRAEALAEGIGG